MKDLSAPIRKGYVDKLVDIGAGVYDELLPNGKSDTKYILLTTFTQDGSRTKNRFECVCSIVADINTRTGKPTGKLECDQLANAVLELINPISRADYIEVGESFECIHTTVLQNETLHDMIETGHNYRRIIRFQHKVLEK